MLQYSRGSNSALGAENKTQKFADTEEKRSDEVILSGYKRHTEGLRKVLILSVPQLSDDFSITPKLWPTLKSTFNRKLFFHVRV